MPSFYSVPRGDNLAGEDANFRNSCYCLETAIEAKYTELLLGNQTNRIIYSLNNFAFRKRASTNNNNFLDMPFMNYKIKSISNKTERPWFNFKAAVEGIYFPILNRKLRIQPITINYEATIWLARDDEMQYLYQKLIFDQAVETKVTYYIEILGQEIPVLGVIDYHLAYEPNYNEKDWLAKNSIHSIQLDFSVQTFYILDNLEISIPDKVLFGFSVQNEIDTTNLSTSDIMELLIDHYAEETVEV
jgi:hypothetical protein